MRALFYSIKGGQGKTTHAVSYAKHARLRLVTNDHQNGTLEIYGGVFPPGHLTAVRPEDSFDPLRHPDTVFDFAGYLDGRVIAAARASDVCVVPVCFQSTADMVPAISTVRALLKLNPNVTVVINNTERDVIPLVREILGEQFPDLPVFVVNKSRYVWRLADEGRTLLELVTLGGLYEHTLRKMIPQVEALYRHLDRFRYRAEVDRTAFEPIRLFGGLR
ncbi:hypothetical protein [Chthonobacter albigriseus]|uniref:hypothetical protein n=1 Tax=Chthonobacter albigriseus TaxID=1683161 RepID=UPI0015EF4125|nr:hypothetical protein [Chthonobacter albigriseus]